MRLPPFSVAIDTETNVKTNNRKSKYFKHDITKMAANEEIYSEEEYKLVIENLERLRYFIKLDMQEMDEYANLGQNTYSRIIAGKQQPRLDELITIGKLIYNLKAIDLFKPNLQAPALNHLPEPIRRLTKARAGKLLRVQKKRDIIYYCIALLTSEFNVGDEFTNSEITRLIKANFKDIHNSKSIEWNKSILAPFIEDTGKTRPGRTRPHKVFRLNKKIPQELVKKAAEAIR